MHPNPAFRQTPPETALDIARDRGFGILCLNGEAGPMLAHVPFEIDTGGTTATLHLARSNPIARAGLPAAAVLAVSGPDAYVSPDWYGLPDQVPTWNYVAVHLRGSLHPLPPEALRPHLDRVSARFEGALAPKRPWTADKMSEGTMERMMRGILPFRLVIGGVESTVKLSQNKPAAAQAGAADGIAAVPLGLEGVRIAALMRGQDGL
ncbi:MAG TPA: FMN-binding negative transcriptional regulator [Paracoccaceae bacterium]|nr:FMN-binding negative transcriptional regulator [Paracoccaceae bacterium]HMO72247.1 FMN-binding negative transcriptional regulator [Paracoccaceae bacterium]